MGWVKGSDRNFKASQTERYRKTKKEFLTTPRTFFSKTMLDSTCKYTFSHLRYFTYTRFFDGTPRVRAPAAPRLISQLFALLHILPSWRQYLSSFVCESTHKIATFREDLVTADDNGTNIRGNWTNQCLPAGTKFNVATSRLQWHFFNDKIKFICMQPN